MAEDKLILVAEKSRIAEEDCKSASAITFAFHRPWPDRPHTTPYQRTEKVHISLLPAGHMLAYSPFAPAGPCVLSPAAWNRWQKFDQPQPLESDLDKELATQMLLHPLGSPPRPVHTAPQTLTAWMHTTNACDLDCPYCYIRKSSARMDEATGRRAIDALFHTAQKHHYQQVKLKYAGGEALLHFQLVQQLHDYAAIQARRSGIELDEVVLSNGVNIGAVQAHWLAETGVRLMISLDGVGDIHDQLRRQKGGRPTFERIAQTIDHILLPQGIRPDIAMTITGRNAGGAAALAQWALVERNLLLSFNFFRPNLLTAAYADLVLEESQIIKGLIAAYQVIENDLPDFPFLEGLLDRLYSQPHTHACGAGSGGYVVIRHTGDIAQCQQHLDSPVAELNSSTVDLLPLVAAGNIQNRPVTAKATCSGCEFRFRCAGGCPLEVFRTTGRWDVQSPNCNLYKSLYPAALRLEGLRLMKINSLID